MGQRFSGPRTSRSTPTSRKSRNLLGLAMGWTMIHRSVAHSIARIKFDGLISLHQSEQQEFNLGKIQHRRSMTIGIVMMMAMVMAMMACPIELIRLLTFWPESAHFHLLEARGDRPSITFIGPMISNKASTPQHLVHFAPLKWDPLHFNYLEILS